MGSYTMTVGGAAPRAAAAPRHPLIEQFGSRPATAQTAAPRASYEPPAARSWMEPTALMFSINAITRAGKESEIPNFKGSSLGRFPLVLADFWTSDHLSERPRRVDAFFVARARGTLTLKRR